MRLGLGLSFFFFSPCFFQNELETTRRKHPLPERECIAATTYIELLNVFLLLLLLIKHRHDNNQLLDLQFCQAGTAGVEHIHAIGDAIDCYNGTAQKKIQTSTIF